MTMRRFCDRHAARGEQVEIEVEGFMHVDVLAKADEDASGDITDDFDLCEDCAAEHHRFMEGARLVEAVDDK